MAIKKPVSKKPESVSVEGATPDVTLAHVIPQSLTQEM